MFNNILSTLSNFLRGGTQQRQSTPPPQSRPVMQSQPTRPTGPTYQAPQSRPAPAQMQSVPQRQSVPGQFNQVTQSYNTPGNVHGSSQSNGGGGQVLGASNSYQAPQLSPEQIADQALSDAFSEITSQFGQYINDASSGNPFAFDEALAKNAAVQQYAPYYAQTLQQFLRGVNAKQTRSDQDASKLLEELNTGGDYFTGRAKKQLDMAQEQARQGYSDAGLLFSGQRGRAEGLLAVDRNREIQNFLSGQQRKAESVQEQRRRILEDTAVEKVQGERSLAKSQELDVSTAIEDARRRAQSGSNYLEAIGPAPGQNFQDFLRQRQSVLQGFV